jgi:hypothetical protein
MRDAIFGPTPSRGSVPNVRPPEVGSRPAWNTGQVLQQGQGPGQYNQGQYGQPYGGPQAPMGGGGGSFLGTAAAAAAGVVGGGLLMNSIRGMMGGGHQSGFGDSAGLGGGGGGKPWSSDQSGSDLARDAGINDIGSGGHRADDSSRAGFFDQASNDDDHDDMDMDADDFDGGGDSDTA